MSSAEAAAAISRVSDAADAPTLARLELELRAAYPGHPDAETIARQATLKRRQLVVEKWLR